MSDPAPRLVYLHGFASSPASRKAARFREAFSARGWDVEIPDLNPAEFSDLTVGYMLDRAREAVRRDERPVVLAGSSLGGYVASLLVAEGERPRALVLLAPAFDLHSRWSGRLGEAALEAWRRFGAIKIWHHGYAAAGRDAECQLDFAFYEEARRYPPFPEGVEVPQIVFHGREDEVVPLASVETYVSRYPEARFRILEDDHSLGATVDTILEETFAFLAAS